MAYHFYNDGGFDWEGVLTLGDHRIGIHTNPNVELQVNGDTLAYATSVNTTTTGGTTANFIELTNQLKRLGTTIIDSDGLIPFSVIKNYPNLQLANDTFTDLYTRVLILQENVLNINNVPLFQGANQNIPYTSIEPFDFVSASEVNDYSAQKGAEIAGWLVGITAFITLTLALIALETKTLFQKYKIPIPSIPPSNDNPYRPAPNNPQPNRPNGNPSRPRPPRGGGGGGGGIPPIGEIPYTRIPNGTNPSTSTRTGANSAYRSASSSISALPNEQINLSNNGTDSLPMGDYKKMPSSIFSTNISQTAFSNRRL